jgi:Helicase conserved C-terminal domain
VVPAPTEPLIDRCQALAAVINGDERLDGLEQALGEVETISQPREHAADAFNAGKVRFLVSTEAGGEGIDLQERCAVLVHADMPWNPMRLHQRVGRLSRYGQTRPVSVYILRNPDTVEARIWDLLNAKLERIQAALSSVMEEQEDISQLVIGMAGNSLFNELFSGSEGLSGERLGAWFDRTTATLGGRDVVETVRELLGNVSRFDFQEVGKDLPKVDLPDLERFFIQAVSRHGRRIFRRDDGLEIRTPDSWKARSYALRDKYEGLVFDRGLRGANAASRVLGVGHLLFDIAVEDAQKVPARFTCIDGLKAPLLIVTVEDEVTGSGTLVHSLIFGVTEKSTKIEILRDWELLQALNALTPKGSPGNGTVSGDVEVVLERLKREFDANLSLHASTLRKPVSWPEMLLLPGRGA